MLLIIWLIGAILGIALLWLGILANRDGALWSGVILIFLCGGFTLTSLGLYIHSCMVVADLKSFDAAGRQNYETIAKQVKDGISWSNLPEAGIYGQAKTIETFGLIVNEYIEKVRWYNEELGRLRNFNEDIWIDLVFKSPPADLGYILLKEE
ncbi:hypothetical protein ES703_27684 [subsurface metagenome]